MRNIFETAPAPHEEYDNQEIEQDYEAGHEQSPELQKSLGELAIRGEVFDLSYVASMLDAEQE